MGKKTHQTLLEKIIHYEDSTIMNHALGLSDLSSQACKPLLQRNPSVNKPHAQPETSTRALQGFPETNTMKACVDTK